jgi:hypothetical protein
MATAAAVLLAGGADAVAQTPPTIIESEGEASIEVAPDELRFELERSFSGPTLVEAMKQVRAFERAVSQGVTELEIPVARQEGARIHVHQGPARIDARIALSVGAGGKDRSQPSAPEAYVETGELMRKLGAAVSSEVVFAGYAVIDRDSAEREAVERAAENALYLADAAGELVQRHVVDVEKLTIVERRWDGIESPPGGAMSVPPEVRCYARVRIAYRYESGAAR